MYSLSNLIVYYDKDFIDRDIIRSILTSRDALFKEYSSLKSLFPALKNPQNNIIIAINQMPTLHQIEEVASKCYNYQNRVFAIFSSNVALDNFFKHQCTISQPNPLIEFLKTRKNNNFTSAHSSNILNKLIALELKNMGLSSKYVGFRYLVGAATDALSKNFYANSYIDLFTNVASIYLQSVDTIERSVRHMLRTSWKNIAVFREKFQPNFCTNKSPNARDLIKIIIEYLKEAL